MGPLSSVARLGPRARARSIVALPRHARERGFLEARALYITSLCTPAPGDPGFRLRRGIAGRLAAHERAWHSPRSSPTAGGEARARPTPRQAGRPPATGCRREHTSCRRRAFSCCRRPVSRSHRRGPARGVLHPRMAGRVTDRHSAEAKPRRGVGRRREHAHVRAHAAGAVTAPVQARGRWSGGGAP